MPPENSSSLSSASCDSASSRRMLRALVTIPRCGLASSNRKALKCPRFPSSASEVIAVNRSARSASSRAAPTARQANALMNEVPFVSASPSFASSARGSRPSSASASAALHVSPLNVTVVSPTIVRPTYESGTKSPLAPQEPRSGIRGSTSLLSRSSRRSTSSTRTPELPFDRQFARSRIATRVTSGGAIGPVPHPRNRKRFRCSSAVLPDEI